MSTPKHLFLRLSAAAIAAGFAGIGVMGIGLMAAALWYQTGVLWGIVVFVLGFFGVCLAGGMAMTLRNQPARNPA
jgi:hypothetical protein